MLRFFRTLKYDWNPAQNQLQSKTGGGGYQP